VAALASVAFCFYDGFALCIIGAGYTSPASGIMLFNLTFFAHSVLKRVFGGKMDSAGIRYLNLVTYGGLKSPSVIFPERD
jgi:hypothetical protein